MIAPAGMAALETGQDPRQPGRVNIFPLHPDNLIYTCLCHHQFLHTVYKDHHMNGSFFSLRKGAGAFTVAAIHHGHTLRPEVARTMKLDAVKRALAPALPGPGKGLEKVHTRR